MTSSFLSSPITTAPIPLQGIGYGGVYGTKRALDRWKYRSRPPRTTLNGAITNVAASMSVNGQQFFPQSGTFPIILEPGTGNAEMAFVVVGAGTNNWTIVRGVNGLGVGGLAHANGVTVVGKSWYDVLCIGDSTVQCTVQGVDGWVDRLRRALQVDVGGGGALLGNGFYPLWRCGAQVASLFGLTGITNSASEWSFAGTWIQPGAGTATDLMLYDGSLLGLSGVGQVATFTVPTFANVQSVDIAYIPTTTTGQFSVSVNGGAFTNVTANVTLGSGQRIEYVNVAVPAAAQQTIAIRAANAAGTGAAVILAGIKLWSVTPTPGVTTGIMVHNCGFDAQVIIGNTSSYAFPLDRTNASGDNYAFINGQPGAIFPDLVIVGPFSNDTGLVADSVIQQHLANLIARAQTQGDVIGVLCSEQNRVGQPVTLTTTPVSMAVQSATRLAQRATLLANGCVVVDGYDAFAAEGDLGFAASNADGLMFDTLHWSALGCSDMAARVARVLLGGF